MSAVLLFLFLVAAAAVADRVNFTCARQSCSNFTTTSTTGGGIGVGVARRLTDTPTQPIGRRLTANPGWPGISFQLQQ